MHASIIISAGLAATASANIFKRQDPRADPLVVACYPGLAQSAESGDFSTLDWTAPCNAVQNITYTCMGGAGIHFGGMSGNYTFANTTQRNCICSSQFFDVVQGCNDCFKAHNAPNNGEADNMYYVPTSVLTSFSSSYCAASNTPTAEFFDALIDALPSTSESLATATAITTHSDPLSGSTAVSLYFTAVVTGDAVNYVPEATVTPSSDGETFSQSIVTNSAGIIVPSVATMTTSASGTASAIPTAQTNAAATWIAQPAIGVIAMAGAVMLL